MGNHITHHSSIPTAKVVLSDGSVEEFDKPLTVAELMLEYPNQVVVEFDDQLGMCKKRPVPLPADKKLETAKLYLMLPLKRGKPASLSSTEARVVVLSANSVLRSKWSNLNFLFPPSSKFLPLLARMCPAGESFVVEKKKMKKKGHYSVSKETKAEEDKFCALDDDVLQEVLDGRPEFLSRQFSGKGWKPSLDTIKEKKVEKKMSHWLF